MEYFSFIHIYIFNLSKTAGQVVDPVETETAEDNVQNPMSEWKMFLVHRHTTGNDVRGRGLSNVLQSRSDMLGLLHK